jgi:hypothetical protein
MMILGWPIAELQEDVSLKRDTRQATGVLAANADRYLSQRPGGLAVPA